MPSSSSLRFPAHRFPRGWFQIGWSHDIAPGEMKPMKYFGQDLIAFRTESGKLSVLDAHCQHLGANIGVGGKVDGESVMCPWHGWRWGTDGHNTLIPYSVDKCKQNVAIRSWPCRDYYGIMIVWHDWDPATADKPMWEPREIPELEDDSYYPMHPQSDNVWRVRAHPQMVLENAVDFAHIEYIHGHSDPPRQDSLVFDGPWMRSDVAVTYGKGKASTWLTPNGPVDVVLEMESTGISFGTVRFRGGYPTLQMSSITPVDEEYSDYYFQQTSLREEGDEGDEMSGMARKMLDLQLRVIPQDFFIWENMSYLEIPHVTSEEAKTYLEMRRWARQFYPPEDQEALSSPFLSEAR